MMSCLEFGGQRWGWHSSLFSVPSIFQDIECSEAEADVAGTTMAIYTVQAEGDDHDGPGGLFADVGMVLEGVKVLNNLKSINHACVMLYGLIYALNLSYPKNLKYTFEAYQKILMDLESSKPSPKVRALKLKLLRWLFFWGGVVMGGGSTGRNRPYMLITMCFIVFQYVHNLEDSHIEHTES